MNCPTCGQPVSRPVAVKLTDRELDALSAWHYYRNVKRAAVLIGVTEQRTKSLLMAARNRNHVQTNEELLVLHLDDLRSVQDLAARHNLSRSAA